MVWEDFRGIEKFTDGALTGVVVATEFSSMTGSNSETSVAVGVCLSLIACGVLSSVVIGASPLCALGIEATDTTKASEISFPAFELTSVPDPNTLSSSPSPARVWCVVPAEVSPGSRTVGVTNGGVGSTGCG